LAAHEESAAVILDDLGLDPRRLIASEEREPKIGNIWITEPAFQYCGARRLAIQAEVYLLCRINERRDEPVEICDEAMFLLHEFVPNESGAELINGRVRRAIPEARGRQPFGPDALAG